ncbi:protein of unknown function [Rhodovastum atsumiense]|nr:protein of unknown function [Rhodovastum atsumiense]
MPPSLALLMTAGRDVDLREDRDGRREGVLRHDRGRTLIATGVHRLAGGLLVGGRNLHLLAGGLFVSGRNWPKKSAYRTSRPICGR